MLRCGGPKVSEGTLRSSASRAIPASAQPRCCGASAAAVRGDSQVAVLPARMAALAVGGLFPGRGRCSVLYCQQMMSWLHRLTTASADLKLRATALALHGLPPLACVFPMKVGNSSHDTRGAPPHAKLPYLRHPPVGM